MTKEKLNLGAAFERMKCTDKVDEYLLNAYIEAETIIKEKEGEFYYAKGYGKLTGALMGYFIRNGMRGNELDKAIDESLEQK